MKLQSLLIFIKRISKYLNSDKGFTLIELLIVITIIAILSIIVVPRFMDIPQKAKVEAARQQIAAFSMALDHYYLDNGNYPTTEQGLQALIEKPTTDPIPQNYNPKGYMDKKKIPNDPWGNPYVYNCPGQHGNDYEIMSYGADGKEGGSGFDSDITSWQ
ncbi:MAG: type II secretion system major pseudopilin GspG [Spirochaetes bacterium]|nr:type II secretion system major pseudopilin GspG [Spirochaetota bacterium]